MNWIDGIVSFFEIMLMVILPGFMLTVTFYRWLNRYLPWGPIRQRRPSWPPA